MLKLVKVRIVIHVIKMLDKNMFIAFRLKGDPRKILPAVELRSGLLILLCMTLMFVTALEKVRRRVTCRLARMYLEGLSVAAAGAHACAAGPRGSCRLLSLARHRRLATCISAAAPNARPRTGPSMCNRRAAPSPLPLVARM